MLEAEEGAPQEVGLTTFWERCTSPPIMFSLAFLVVAAGGPEKYLFTLCFVVLEVCARACRWDQQYLRQAGHIAGAGGRAEVGIRLA